MSRKEDRREFAKSRPLPPFGVVLKWLSDVLQLRDIATYKLGADGLDKRTDLKHALNELESRTLDDVFAGLMVKEKTRQRTCKAFAQCLRELPGLPINSISVEELSAMIRECWTGFERASGMLSSISDYRGQIKLPLFRHATVELAVRAGAVAFLCGDPDVKEERPVWSQDTELKQQLRELFRLVGPRDKSVENLRQSRSEVGRWLDALDVPQASAIEKWESLLVASVKGRRSETTSRSLWRLFIGRRIWVSVRDCVSVGSRDELLRAYARIKRRVHAYLALERRYSQEENRKRALSLALGGRIEDPLLAAQVLNGESDVFWRRHIEAILQIDGVPTVDIVRLCQTWVAVYSIYDDPACIRKPDIFDDFIRDYFLRADQGGGPTAEYAKILEELNRYESKWDFDAAAASAVKLVSLAPFAADSWYALGRIRRFQKNREATEWCFRKALELDPTALEARTDLVVLLALAARIEEAREVLENCLEAQKARLEWRFAHGLVLLSSQQPQEALDELLKCAKEGFVPSVCYQFAAIAAEILELPNEMREYRKRAAELGG